jgi:hypothetical protein
MLTTACLADYRAWIGWDALVERIGLENVPTGADVIVGQVEAANTNGYYVPDAANAEFDGKYIIRRSGGSAMPSSHATGVGKRLYGLDTSIAPGVWFINVFEANDWVQGGFLNVGAGPSTPPEDAIGAQKVWSHSWVGSFGNATYDVEALRRLDWTIERDDSVYTVGLNNGGEQMPLLAYAYNAISVGRRDGDHAAGDVPAGFEGEGRMMPDITGPEYTTSNSTPIVAASVAMLVEMVRTDDTLHSDGEQPEVLKAVLMAAARHQGVDGADWTNNAPQSGPDRGWTARPLDESVGAGHLHIDHAHETLSGGRVSPAANAQAAPSAGMHGWSFEQADADDQMWWRFTLPEGAAKFAVSAAWNRVVPSNFGQAAVADFDLELFTEVDGAAVPLVGDDVAFGGGNVASASEVDNVEHLWITDLAAGDYLLVATRVDGGGDPAAVALAWWNNGDAPDVPGDLDGDGLVGVDDLLILLSQWGDCGGCAGDLDGDSVVGVDDLLTLIALFS